MKFNVTFAKKISTVFTYRENKESELDHFDNSNTNDRHLEGSRKKLKIKKASYTEIS